jgi:hypothetical protein
MEKPLRVIKVLKALKKRKTQAGTVKCEKAQEVDVSNEKQTALRISDFRLSARLLMPTMY